MLSLSTHSESVEGPTETVAEVLPPPVQCAANVCTIYLTLILGPATISIALCEVYKTFWKVLPGPRKYFRADEITTTFACAFLTDF